MKKVLCLMMSVCLLLGLVSCKGVTYSNDLETNDESQSAVDSDTSISLLYSYSDTFDPYTAKTEANREIGMLIYDCLVKTDNAFEPQLGLAESVAVQDTVYTVTLKSAVFTDGSTVTSDDIIYSYNLAKDCVRYSGNFYEVLSVSAAGQSAVEFTLSQNDPYFINLLDFPIVKSGTSGVTNADGKEIPPVGCGRYALSDDGLSLMLNQSYYGEKGVIEKINLINSPDATSTSHYVEVGATHIYYNDNGDVVRMSGKKTEVNLNRYVYIGVNSAYGSLSTKEMRYALSAALDRETICRTAYYNNATAANGFFNPAFAPTSAVQTIESKPNFKITVENLAKIGYNNMNANGFYANSSGNNPVFTLLVNSENTSRVAAAELIAKQCETAGIQIKVVTCSYEQYVERLANGDFQLYLGEVQLLDNMDLSSMVIPGGAAAYGVTALQESQEQSSDGKQDASDAAADEQQVQKTACEIILEKYHTGQCSIGDVASVLLAEMPQIPICYLNGNLFYDAKITGGIVSSSSDIYLTIQNYEF